MGHVNVSVPKGSFSISAAKVSGTITVSTLPKALDPMS